MALTTENIKNFIETDLADAELQFLIDAAYDDITIVAGAIGEQTTIKEISLPTKKLFLTTPISNISEIQIGLNLNELSVIDPSEYVLLNAHTIIRTNSMNWAKGFARITFTPQQDVTRRDAVALDLVKLAIQYEGVQSQSAGDFSETKLNYVTEKNKILRQMLRGRRWIV